MAWLLITFPVFWLGVGTRYPFAWFGPYEQSLGVLFWATVTTLWIAGFVRQWGKRLPQQTLHRIYAVYVGLSLVLVPILDLVQAAHFKAHGYQFPSWLLILSGLQGLVAWIVFKSCKASIWFGKNCS